MSKKEKRTSPDCSAEKKGCIDAGNAEVSNSQSGVEKHFDAESDRKTAEFEELISGKYKKQFSEKVSSIISRRLKEVNSMQEKAEKNAAIVEMLMKKFNVENTDTQELERVIDENMNNSDKNYANLIRKLIAENSFLKKENERRIHDAKAQSLAEKIKSQVEETKKIYPDFDMRKEIENPEFTRLIKAGVSVKNAYEVMNIEGILNNNSKEAERVLLDSIKNKKNRPVENGSALSGGILLSGGISKLTKKQRAELAKRAASGEKIEF